MRRQGGAGDLPIDLYKNMVKKWVTLFLKPTPPKLSTFSTHDNKILG